MGALVFSGALGPGWQSEHESGSGFDTYGLRYGDVIFGDGFEQATP